MKKIVAVFLMSVFGVALAATVALASYGESESTDNSIVGRVREAGTKLSLKKAKVKLYTSSGKLKKSKKTDGAGKYKFSGLNKGSFKVKVSLAGYRNPKDARKVTVSKTAKVHGNKKFTKNLYLQKI